MKHVEANATIDTHRVASPLFGGSSKPWTRWWWLGGPYRDEDLEWQLTWVRDQGFGGVEVAWLRPDWQWREGDREIPGWLGPEWQGLVGRAKAFADSIGLGCDFTFGSAWPFGGHCVGEDDASWTFFGPSSERVHLTWEEAAGGPPPRILDHLSAEALRRYAAALAPAFAAGLRGTRSALFCDSFEIRKRDLWGRELDAPFRARFGYQLREHLKSLERNPGLRYDHRRFLGEVMVDAFFGTFTEVCHRLGAWSRVQCHGAPVDLLQAYARADVPESEALLFPPTFSRIAASAAALAGKTITSCETFTCIYGFPTKNNLLPVLLWKKELTADLSLLADALFANGVNQVVWHGLPRNGPAGGHEFYAAVHVGPDAGFAGDLGAFNAYLERVSGLLRLGRPCCRLAVYLPQEDGIIAGEPDDRIPGEQDLSEMRRYVVPRTAEAFAPLWVSEGWLREAEVVGGRVRVGALEVEAVLVDVEWLDPGGLGALLDLARAGARVVLTRPPRAPGFLPPPDFEARVSDLRGLPSVTASAEGLQPLVAGEDLPPYWARTLADGALLLFFAHPAAREIRYPMPRGLSGTATACRRQVRVYHTGRPIELTLEFPARRSLCVWISAGGEVAEVDLEWTPPAPSA